MSITDYIDCSTIKYKLKYDKNTNRAILTFDNILEFTHFFEWIKEMKKQNRVKSNKNYLG